MKSLVKKENYINIQGWMLTELNLKGNEILIYAIIYGFSQDESSSFRGSLQYLADWTNSTKQGVLKCLQNLLEKNLIIKKEEFRNNIKLVEYSCTKVNTIQQSLTPIQQSLMGGIKQSLTNNIALDTIADKQDCIAMQEQNNFSKNEKVLESNPYQDFNCATNDAKNKTSYPIDCTIPKTTQTPNSTLSELSLESFKDFWSLHLLRTPPANGFETEFRKFFDYWGRIKPQRKESKYANDWKNYLKEWITHDWNIKPKDDSKNAPSQQMVQPDLTDNKIPCVEIPIIKPDILLLNERMINEIMQTGSVHGLNYSQYFKKCFIIDYDFKETEGIIKVDVIINTHKAKDAILSNGKMEILQDSIRRAFNKKNILIEINLQIPPQGECINIKLVGEKI